MALPHMPSAYTTRKNMYEAAIVRRRTHEEDFRTKWAGNARYFSSESVRSSKQRDWTSDGSYQDSMDAYNMKLASEAKEARLKNRQSRLRQLLQQEKDEYEAELRDYSVDNHDRLNDMKDRSESLRSAREEKRQQLAEVKYYELFRKNSPDMRQLESLQMKQAVVDKWSEQLDEKKEAAEEARRADEAMESALELERLAALEAERRRQQEAIDDEYRLKEVLRTQIAELKEREREAELLKQQHDSLERQQWELDRLEEEQKRREDERAKQERGRVLLRQHAAHLRKKSKQIQEELEQDKQVLETLIQREMQDVALQTARRERAQADASWMKKVIEDQLRLEKEREAELDALYQDEASRLWHKREEEWNREKAARERLMKEVLAERQEQVARQMDALRQRQAESIERREELVREVEAADRLTRREQALERESRVQRRAELDAEVTARRDQKAASKMEELDELMREQQAEQDYDEFVRQEAERMSIRGYETQRTQRQQQPQQQQPPQDARQGRGRKSAWT